MHIEVLESSRVSANDAMTVVGLLQQLYDELRSVPTLDNVITTAKHHQLVVVRLAGIIVGMGTLVMYPRFGIVTAHAEDVVVSQEHRGQGIATAIMRRIAELAKREGAACLDLETDPWRSEATKLYDKLHYTDTKKRVLRLAL